MEFDQTAVRRARRPKPLPDYYYLRHFLELLDFVEAHYAHALGDEHRQLIDDYRRLPKSAQCLYVRLANRKGCLFDRRRLRYPEIDELGGVDCALFALEDGGWIGPPEARHFGDVLNLLTRAELVDALLPDCVGLSRSLRKGDYVELARRHCEPAAFVARLDARRCFVQRRHRGVQYLLFLYFGRLPDGLAQFTMRDLGLLRTQSFTDGYEPRFEEREEAQEQFYYARRMHRLREAKDDWTIRDLLADANDWPEPRYRGSTRLRDRFVLRLGRTAERLGLRNDALNAYASSMSPECTERRIRLLLAGGRREEARGLLESILARDDGDSRWLFARDLYERKFDRKRTAAATDLLRASDCIDIDESLAETPERAAVTWFRRRGCRAWRVENSLWRTFFGLLFWDELFAAERSALHSPFEWRPDALSDGRFYSDRAAQIEAALAGLGDRPALVQRLLQTSTRHYGTANGVFRWRRRTLDALFALLQVADTASFVPPLRNLARRFADASHGYPDLLVIDESGARFVEIKAEGDQLRPNQLARLEELRQAGLRADVLRIRWIVDPDREYVVVDVETTGGKGADHRITEFGAVRMAGDRIVDRFETLLNPERPIPPGITRLTGISQERVAKAPRFADVADTITDFIGECVFVAHNVGFDYRFVRSEFERLGRSFRRPKLCTCSGMRRQYPGLPSYSLAALCRNFDIPLERHHRALCDAEAAAELLVLINERRRERLAAGDQNGARDQ